MTNKEEIFGLIKDKVVEVLPFLDSTLITPESSLRDFGANSIDRMEILLETMEALNAKVPMTEFGKITNIQGIVDLLYEKLHEG